MRQEGSSLERDSNLVTRFRWIDVSTCHPCGLFELFIQIEIIAAGLDSASVTLALVLYDCGIKTKLLK